MQFKIYYDNGFVYVPQCDFREGHATFETAEGTFTPGSTPMPKRGVIAIVQRHPNAKWVVASGYDYYTWKGFWRGCDFFGMLEYLQEAELIDFGIGWKKIFHKGKWIKADIVDFFAFIEEDCPILIGRWTLSTEYENILLKAEEDREFGIKNGFVRMERPLAPFTFKHI